MIKQLSHQIKRVTKPLERPRNYGLQNNNLVAKVIDLGNVNFGTFDLDLSKHHCMKISQWAFLKMSLGLARRISIHSYQCLLRQDSWTD